MILHSIFETIYALLGLFIAIVAVYSGNNSRPFMFLRYFGVAIFILTALHITAADMAPANLEYWTASSWLLIKVVAPIIIIFMLNGFTINGIAFGMICFFVSIVCITLPLFNLFYTGWVISRPLEFAPILLHGYLLVRVYKTKQSDCLKRSVTTFAILNIISHLVVMFSYKVYDAQFIISHVIQIGSLIPFFIYFKIRKEQIENEIKNALNLRND